MRSISKNGHPGTNTTKEKYHIGEGIRTEYIFSVTHRPEIPVEFLNLGSR